MLDRIFHDQEQIYRSGDIKGGLLPNAKANGLSDKQFDACVSDETALNALNARSEKGGQDGVSSTPTFFINGKKAFEGVPTPEQLDAAVPGRRPDSLYAERSIRRRLGSAPSGDGPRHLHELADRERPEQQHPQRRVPGELGVAMLAGQVDHRKVGRPGPGALRHLPAVRPVAKGDLGDHEVDGRRPDSKLGQGLQPAADTDHPMTGVGQGRLEQGGEMIVVFDQEEFGGTWHGLLIGRGSISFIEGATGFMLNDKALRPRAGEEKWVRFSARNPL